MKYWWVNHNKTGELEVSGGYLWSPKRSSDDRYNQTYENMRVAAPGHPLLSFRGSAIRSVGVVVGIAQESRKPVEFGEAGEEWASVGWKLAVVFADLPETIVPRDHIERLRPYLPAKHSPIIKETGVGAQAYLFEIGEQLYLETMSLVSGGSL